MTQQETSEFVTNLRGAFSAVEVRLLLEQAILYSMPEPPLTAPYSCG